MDAAYFAALTSDGELSIRQPATGQNWQIIGRHDTLHDAQTQLRGERWLPDGSNHWDWRDNNTGRPWDGCGHQPSEVVVRIRPA